MRVRQALVIYTAFLVGFVILLWMAIHWRGVWGWIVTIGYGGAGLFLNRSVLPRLITWHPAYSTLQNISRGKLEYFLAWPLAYPRLFFRLGISKYL